MTPKLNWSTLDLESDCDSLGGDPSIQLRLPWWWYMVYRQDFKVPSFLYFEPSMDDFSLRSDVISATKILSWCSPTARGGEARGTAPMLHQARMLSCRAS